MIEPSRAQEPTTAMAYAAMLAREALAAESRPPYDLRCFDIICTNPDSADGMRNYIAEFLTVDGRIQIFDGRSWTNRPE